MVAALFVLAAKAGAEGFGIGAVGEEEAAEGGDLGGEIGGPVEQGFRFQIWSFKFGVLQRQRAFTWNLEPET